MKKIAKLVCLALILTLVLGSLAACGGGTASSEAATPAASASETAAPAEEASEAAPESTEAAGDDMMRTVLITPQKLGDGSVVDTIWELMQEGGKEFGFEPKIVEPDSGEYEETTRAMAEEGYDLIYGLFTTMQDGFERVAPDFPDTMFVLMFGDLDMPNVRTVNYGDQESAFLCGVVAAQSTQTGKVGVIGGAEVADNLRMIAGYEAGAKAVNPDIEVSHMFVGSFEDPSTGKELANVMLDDGYDIIMQGCAASSMGIREALKERGEGHYLIGTDILDLDAMPGQVLCGSVQNHKAMVYEPMETLRNGTFAAGVFFLGLADDGVRIEFRDEADPAIVYPEGTHELVEEYQQKIESGEIVVPMTLE